MLPCRPEHLKTFDYCGPHRYFLTFCTRHRRRLFVTPERVAAVLLQIQRVAGDGRFAILAYCFMPDHVHLLVEGQSEDADCRRFIARAKQFSGFHCQREFGERLWQPYGYERTLRNHDSTLSIARYIVENPVRAGLVSSAEDHPFTGSDVWKLPEILAAIQMRPHWRARSG